MSAGKVLCATALGYEFLPSLQSGKTGLAGGLMVQRLRALQDPKYLIEEDLPEQPPKLSTRSGGGEGFPGAIVMIMRVCNQLFNPLMD